MSGFFHAYRVVYFSEPFDPESHTAYGRWIHTHRVGGGSLTYVTKIGRQPEVIESLLRFVIVI